MNLKDFDKNKIEFTISIKNLETGFILKEVSLYDKIDLIDNLSHHPDILSSIIQKISNDMMTYLRENIDKLESILG